jgi:hypothetical protein
VSSSQSAGAAHKDIDLVLHHRALADEHAGEDALSLGWTNGMTVFGLAMVLASLALVGPFHSWRSWLWTGAAVEVAAGAFWLIFVQFLWRAFVVGQSARRIASGWKAVAVMRTWTDAVTRGVFSVTLGSFVAGLIDHWHGNGIAQHIAFIGISVAGLAYAIARFRWAGAEYRRYDAPTS